MMSSKKRASSLDSSLSSASTTELEARKAATNVRLLELEDEEIEETDNGMASPKSISATMDEYVSASFVGRSSYASGDVLNAVTQFNEALGIELQTELDCLYDTNLGFVSGLVRREVQSRMYDSPAHSRHNCKNILDQLADVYIKASSESDKHPSKSKWYLRMGAALCVINEWDKAKQVYKEGINMCKDKKELKAALKNLVKLEQITATADIPDEDRYGTKPPPSPAKSVKSQPLPQRTGSPKMVRRKSSKIKLRKRSKSMTAELNKTKAESFDGTKIPLEAVDTIITSPKDKDNPITQRSNSIDSGFLSPGTENQHLKLTKTASSDVPLRPKEDIPIRDSAQISPLAASDGFVQIKHGKEKDKRFSVSLLGSAKRNSFGAFLFGRPTPTLSSEDKQLWTECFSPESCTVASYHSMTTSAVAHMRRLSVEPIKRENHKSTSSDDQKDGPEEHSVRRETFEATPIKSMTIESDDSELDEYD